MTDTLGGSDPEPCEPDLDDNGVDLAQIREMLDLTPAERLLVIENLADSMAQIRRLNDPRGPLMTADLDLVHRRSADIELKEKAGRPKDLAVLPVLRATLAEALRRS